METSWYGVFDMNPADTIQVRAGDLQEFLRQQMMGVPNPGLTVTTMEERDDTETFCTIRWMRDDIVSAVNLVGDVNLDREGPHAEEVEEIIDSVIDAIGDGLDESSTEHGWELIYQLIPDEAIEKAKELVSPVSDKEQVKGWYMRTYPNDELGEQIATTLTFGDALRAVPSGADFYAALGIGDSIVRERVFEELASRTGLGYDDIYERWLNQTPWSASELPLGTREILRAASERDEPIRVDASQRVSLSDTERDNRASADALSGSNESHGDIRGER